MFLMFFRKVEYVTGFTIVCLYFGLLYSALMLLSARVA